MNKKKIIMSLAVAVLLLTSCGSETLPDGFYVQEDGSPFGCITFEIRKDTIFWKKNFKEEKPKDFVYEISGGELRGYCAAQDERLIKPCLFVENGVILDGKIFRQYNPNFNKLPDGDYQNYDAVPKYTSDLQVRGDSIFTQIYRYEERISKTRALVKLIGKNRLCFMDPKSDDTNVVDFQMMPDGFIIDETRYTKLETKQ